MAAPAELFSGDTGMPIEVGRRYRFEVHVPHQPAVGMIEDMTVEHPHAGTLVEVDEESNRAVDRNVDGVLPRHRPNRLEIFVERQICRSPTVARYGFARQNGTPFTWNSDFPSGPAGGSVRRMSTLVAPSSFGGSKWRWTSGSGDGGNVGSSVNATARMFSAVRY
jgi:hypothetical protein